MVYEGQTIAFKGSIKGKYKSDDISYSSIMSYLAKQTEN